MSEQAPQTKSLEERIKELPEGSISTYTETLLADKDRDPDEIVDRYIGAMLTTLGAREGATTIHDIDINSTKVEWPVMFTRKSGLRRSIFAMGMDERTANAVGVMRGRLGGTLEEPIMTNENQLAGFLEAFDADESVLHDTDRGVSWKQTIAQELTKYFTIPQRAEAWKTRENLGSDVQSVRANQQEWERAVNIARKLGFDIDTFTKSAEYTRERTKTTNRQLGAVSLNVVVDNYDHLFQ